MKKQLTEKEAWEFCAKAFESLVFSRVANCIVSNLDECAGYQCAGLCDVIKCVLDTKLRRIDGLVKLAMLKQIAPLTPTDDWGFKFSTDEAGAKLRVKFCRDQIKRIEEEEKKKCDTCCVTSSR